MNLIVCDVPGCGETKNVWHFSAKLNSPTGISSNMNRYRIFDLCDAHLKEKGL